MMLVQLASTTSVIAANESIMDDERRKQLCLKGMMKEDQCRIIKVSVILHVQPRSTVNVVRNDTS